MTRTLSNGYTYEVVENFFGGYNLYYKNERMSQFKRNTTSFKSLEEAEQWFEKMEAEYTTLQNEPKEVYKMSPSSYYSITGYYGD